MPDLFLTARFQLRMLKERSKTEVFRSRGHRAGHGGGSRSPWCGSRDIGLKGSAPKRELRFEQDQKFVDMLDKVDGFSVKREQSVAVSDCEDHFSEA